MRTSRKDITKNNFSGIDISQGLELEPPSLSPYFLLVCNNMKSASVFLEPNDCHKIHSNENKLP